MPTTVVLLRWIYLARLTLAAGIFAAAVLVWTQPGVGAETTLVATVALIATLAVTAISFWHTQVEERTPSRSFLYAQVVFDVLLVTAVVHLTGGGESEFSALYVVVIAEGAILLPLPGGFLIGALAALLYFADAAWGRHVTEALGGVAYDGAVQPVVTTRMGLFAVLALVTALLGERVRRTGTRLGAIESELAQLRLDHADILRTLDTGVITLDAAGKLVYMNPAAQTLLGMRTESWVGRPALDELDRLAPGLASVVERTLETRQPVPWFETHVKGPPRLRLLGVRSTPLERDGQPWVTLVAQDITDGKRVEAANRRADRMAAVAELAASLAHEIKNPLASIRSAVEQLTRDGAPLQTEDRGLLGGLVLTESDRLSRLLSSFIEFSRVEIRERAAVDLAAVVHGAVEVARRHPDADDGVQIQVDIAGPVEVQGDADLLHRVVFNLVLNAVQHSPAGGTVRVSLEHSDPRATAGSTGSTGSTRAIEGAMLRVSDQGPGIDPDVASQLFDPFVTTRAGGSGLGLALVHRAVEAHDGMILVDDAVGGGTVFTVLLPADQPQVTT
jgi:two-component system, NtrC family, sensor histidine kinase PilS